MNNRNKAILGMALLFSTLGVGVALQGRFSDIPRDFWAEGAVNRMVAEGVVSGYPDGTFRGSNTVNRYEVTSMFDRLFLSRRFITLETNARAASSELTNLRAADVRSNADLTALQADVAALRANGNQTLNVNDRFDEIEKQASERDAVLAELRGELEAVKTQTSQIARLSEQNAALTSRVAQLEQQLAASNSETVTNLQNQVTTLTGRIAQLEQRNDTTALGARVVALEVQTARIPALEAQAAKVASLENQVARIPALETQVAKIPALETQVGSLNTTVANLQKALAERPTAPVTPPAATAPTPPTVAAPTPPAVTAPAPTPPAPPSSPVVTAPTVTAPTLTAPAPTVSASSAPSVPALYVSLGLSSNLLPSGGYNAALGVGGLAQVGLNLSDSFSVRFSADLSEIPSFGANAMLNLGNGFYTGLGGGLVFAGGGIYVGGVIGFSFELAQNFGLFLEANPRLNFATGFGIKTALGVRFGL
jgi:uncharacterized protein YdcH (DUF465 family)